MRIIAGRLRGRRLVVPPGERIRPTSDRVREAMFNVLEARCAEALRGGTVLDAFCGSGALAFEAMSRGAASATLVDNDPEALKFARRNAESLALDDIRLVRGDIFALAQRGRLVGGPFSLLLLDPPYRIERSQVSSLIGALIEHGQITVGGVVVYEHAAGVQVEFPEELLPVTHRTHGSTGFSIATLE